MIDVIGGIRYPRLEPIDCPLCGRHSSPRRFDARFGMKTSVAECTHCRLAYQTPRPSDEASRAYMNWRWSSSGRYVTDSPGKRRSARKKLVHVQTAAPSLRRLLDFGAGSGVFVRACLDAGLEAIGVEQSESAIARAREFYDVELVESIPDSRFGAITMWDVVEHLRDPIALLGQLREKLEPDGSLFMTTGNYENWKRIADGDRWGLYLLDHHYYFTPASLAETTRRAGFSRFRLLDANHSAPPIGRSLRRPKWGLRAWKAYMDAKRAWPQHGDVNIMVAIVQP